MGGLRRIGALVGAFATSGCLLFDFGPGTQYGDETEREIALAVGADVDITLSRACLDSTTDACSEQDVVDIVDATISGDDEALDLLDQGSLAGVGTFRIRATRPGTARLVVEYIDFSGASNTQAVRLRAAEITSSFVDITCDDTIERGGLLPISAGSQFGFSTGALADDIPLATGNLSLFDPGPFQVTPPNGSRGVAIAPDRPGRTTWSLTGGGSVALDVYDPSELELGLVPDDDTLEAETSLILQRVVGGELSCVHGQDQRAVIDIAAGDCRPVLSGVELVGGLPVNLRHGNVWFSLAGTGSCSVIATVDGSGASADATVDVVTVTPGVVASGGFTLSAADTQVGGRLPPGSSCAEAFSDGDCDPGTPDDPDLDGDCFFDSDWEVFHADGTLSSDNAVGDEPVGTGLTTALHLQVEAFLLVSPPFHLRVDGPSSMLYESVGCTEDRQWEIVAITPQSDGNVDLDLEADNIDDTGDFDFTVLDVDQAVYTVREVDSGIAAAVGPVEMFVRSEAHISVQYQRNSGTRLRGIAPIRVTTSDSAGQSTVRDDRTVHTGELPATISIASPVAPQVQTILVRDQTGIAGLANLEDSSLATGDVLCQQLAPLGMSGDPILGFSPVRPRLTLAGTAVVVSGEPGGEGLCLEGFAAGTSSVDVAWGAATVQRTWTVD